MIQSRRSFEVNPDKAQDRIWDGSGLCLIFEITLTTQEFLRVSKGWLERGHCVAVVDNVMGSQGWAGEAGRSVVLGRERRGADNRGVGASSLPPPLPPMNPVAAGRGREEAGNQEEGVGIADEVPRPHPREAMPIGWSLCEKYLKISQAVVWIS